MEAVEKMYQRGRLFNSARNLQRILCRLSKNIASFWHILNEDGFFGFRALLNGFFSPAEVKYPAPGRQIAQ